MKIFFQLLQQNCFNVSSTLNRSEENSQITAVRFAASFQALLAVPFESSCWPKTRGAVLECPEWFCSPTPYAGANLLRLNFANRVGLYHPLPFPNAFNIEATPLLLQLQNPTYLLSQFRTSKTKNFINFNCTPMQTKVLTKGPIGLDLLWGWDDGCLRQHCAQEAPGQSEEQLTRSCSSI